MPQVYGGSLLEQTPLAVPWAIVVHQTQPHDASPTWATAGIWPTLHAHKGGGLQRHEQGPHSLAQRHIETMLCLKESLHDVCLIILLLMRRETVEERQALPQLPIQMCKLQAGAGALCHGATRQQVLKRPPRSQGHRLLINRVIFESPPCPPCNTRRLPEPSP